MGRLCRVELTREPSTKQPFEKKRDSVIPKGVRNLSFVGLNRRGIPHSVRNDGEFVTASSAAHAV